LYSCEEIASPRAFPRFLRPGQGGPATSDRNRLSRPLRHRGYGMIRGILNPGRRQAEGLVMRGLDAAIVDEADSVLVDEAVTPSSFHGHRKTGPLPMPARSPTGSPMNSNRTGITPGTYGTKRSTSPRRPCEGWKRWRTTCPASGAAPHAGRRSSPRHSPHGNSIGWMSST